MVVARHPVFAGWLFFTASFWIFNCPDSPAAPSDEPPFAQTIHFTPDTVAVGEASTATVTLSAPAPDGGLALTLHLGAHLTGPASLVVPAGGTTATFVVTPTAVPPDSVATVSIESPGRADRLHGILSVRSALPSQPPKLLFASLTFDVDDVVGGDDLHGTLRLSRAVRTDDPRGVIIDGGSDTEQALFTLGLGVSSLRFKLATNSVSDPRSVLIVAYSSVDPANEARKTIKLRSRVTLSSIDPGTGSLGEQVDVTLRGLNLADGGGTALVPVDGIGITLLSHDDATVRARFAIAEDAALGTRAIQVTTHNGSSGTLPFTVVAPPLPAIASISPAAGDVGFSVPVTITGSNFTAGATVAISGTDVVISGVTVVDSMTITATFQIGQFAPAGARNVTVTTAEGTSDPVTFTINP